MSNKPKCSACASVGGPELHLVIAGVSDPKAQGRVLVYCSDCRRKPAAPFFHSFPLETVTPEFFASLYPKLTESDPMFAAELVFGHPNEQAVRLAVGNLAAGTDSSLGSKSGSPST